MRIDEDSVFCFPACLDLLWIASVGILVFLRPAWKVWMADMHPFWGRRGELGGGIFRCLCSPEDLGNGAFPVFLWDFDLFGCGYKGGEGDCLTFAIALYVADDVAVYVLDVAGWIGIWCSLYASSLLGVKIVYSGVLYSQNLF